MIVLFTDTDTDITPEDAKKYGYRLISMPYCLDDQVVYPYVDFEEFDSKAFYDRLRKGAPLPTTSALSAEVYKKTFEPVFAAGDDIFYVHFSAAMTQTFTYMKQALDELAAKYPERKFWEVDTKGITSISYNLVKEIGDLFLSGKTPEEVLKWAETEVDHFAMYFYADNLTFFKRSGRVSGIAATMGNLIGVRPIICMSAEGKMVSVGKERGREKALERLVQCVADLGDDIQNHRIIVGHSDSPEIAARVADMLRSRFGENLNIETVVVNPTAGSHCGPDGVGICFHAIHR